MSTTKLSERLEHDESEIIKLAHIVANGRKGMRQEIAEIWEQLAELSKFVIQLRREIKTLRRRNK